MRVNLLLRTESVNKSLARSCQMCANLPYQKITTGSL